MKRKGFSTIELVVSVLIISVLMMGVLPTLGVFKSSERVKQELQEETDRIAVSLGVAAYTILYEKAPENIKELTSTGIVLGDENGYELDYEDGFPILEK